MKGLEVIRFVEKKNLFSSSPSTFDSAIPALMVLQAKNETKFKPVDMTHLASQIRIYSEVGAG